MNTKCNKHIKIQLIYYTFNLQDLYINTVQIHQYGPLPHTKRFMFNIKHLSVYVSNFISIKFKCKKQRESWASEREDICRNYGRNKAHLTDGHMCHTIITGRPCPLLRASVCE